MSKQEFKVQLGEDLWTSVQGLGSPLVAVTVLTSLSSHADQRGTFRLEFADRCILKGKRFRTNHEAERVERLSKLLDRQHYPMVLARCGSALLMEWVEGRPLTAEHCQLELLRRCGAMQGLLHNIPLPSELYSQCRHTGHEWQARLKRDLRELMEHGALGKREAERLFDLAVTHSPRNVAVGIVHGDFCAENMIVHASGDVYVVDSENLSIGPYDYDLGRTWYRWPMTQVQREAYYDGYHQYRSSADFVTYLSYWAIGVLAGSAAFRLRAETRDTLTPIQRLKAISQGDLQSRLSLDTELFMKEKDIW